MKYNIFQEACKLAGLPDDTDSNGWGLGKELLYTERLPGLWAKICLVAAALTTKPILRIWLLLECVNGLRRESGKWDVNLAAGLLDEIRKMIELHLPTKGNLHRLRLLELWCYHSGWVYHPAGQFEKAAACHHEAINLAEQREDVRSRALSVYNEAYEILHQYIVEANTKLPEYFKLYRITALETLDVISSDSEDDVRWRANILCHLGFFTWVVTGEITEVGSALTAINSLPPNIRPAFAETEVTLRALNVLPENPAEAVEITSRIDPQGQIDWRSYAMYVHGRALSHLEKEDEAKAIFDQLRALAETENGGHLVRALLTQ